MNRKEFLKLFEKHCRELKAKQIKPFKRLENKLRGWIDTEIDSCPFIRLGYEEDISIGGATVDEITATCSYKSSYFDASMYFQGVKRTKPLAQQMYKVYLKVKGE